MSAYSITYRDGHKVAVPVTREQYLAIRNASCNVVNLRDARKGVKMAKMALAQMNYSCYPNSDGTLKGATRPSATVGMDIDSSPTPSPTNSPTPNSPTPSPSQRRGEVTTTTGGQNSPTATVTTPSPLGVSVPLEGNRRGESEGGLDWVGETARYIVSRAEELDIYMVERSATKGLHVVFKRNTALSNEENIVCMAKKLGVEPDLNAKDITRVFFTTTAAKGELFLLRDELFEDNSPTPNSPTPNSPTPSPSQRRGEVTTTTGSQNSPTAAVTTPSPLGEGREGGLLEERPLEDRLGVSDSYLGIPYSSIIETWWQLHYGGHTPTASNRNTLTFELAVNLRHICGFSEAQLRHIIPCYDGFPEAERDECIKSALNSKRTMMPKRMTAVIEYLQRVNSRNVALVDQLEDVKRNEAFVYENQLPGLPVALQDAVAVSGKGLVFPAIMSVAAVAGFHATNIKLTVHHESTGLNILAFVVGESASGKSCATKIFKAWTRKEQARIDQFYEQEREWSDEAETKRSGKVDKQPKYDVRIITLNNTPPNIGLRLENVKGRYSVSFTSESDSVFARWKGNMEEFSSMLRQAYDEDRYDREAKSAGAVRVHIPHMMWNVLMCGTQDALYRLVTNVTDGFMNRFCFAKTADNTWTPYDDDTVPYTEEQQETIDFVTDCLGMMKGSFKSQVMEKWCLEWIENMRLDSMKAGMDRTLARTRYRSPISAMRATMAAYILPRTVDEMVKFYGSREAVIDALCDNPECWMQFAHGLLDEDTRRFFTTMADYIVDTSLFYFGDQIDAAYNDVKYSHTLETVTPARQRKADLFALLPEKFTVDDIISVYLTGSNRCIKKEYAWLVACRWKQAGLIDGDKGLYWKIKNEI